MEEVRDFRDQMFYREMLRLREEQRSSMELRNRSSNVVSFEQYRREQQQRVQRPTDQPPLKPAS
jgi:hypothetical protein